VENHRVEDVATPEAFQRNPDLVYRFYNARRKQLQQADVIPNAGHYALARLEKRCRGNFILVTQNVDNLHEQAGSCHMIHMHGELLKARCLKSEQVVD
jgi:NAD-dependent deacetylase